MCKCTVCGKDLEKDEIAIFKKLVNRQSEDYLCISCLSDYFEVEETLIREKIEYYKQQGCLLFS